MEDTNQTTASRLTIAVDGTDLPIDEDRRYALFDDLRTAVRAQLEEHHGVETDQDDITVATGYRYAQVPADCPFTVYRRLRKQRVRATTDSLEHRNFNIATEGKRR